MPGRRKKKWKAILILLFFIACISFLLFHGQIKKELELDRKLEVPAFGEQLKPLPTAVDLLKIREQSS